MRAMWTSPARPSTADLEAATETLAEHLEEQIVRVVREVLSPRLAGGEVETLLQRVCRPGGPLPGVRSWRHGHLVEHCLCEAWKLLHPDGDDPSQPHWRALRRRNGLGAEYPDVFAKARAAFARFEARRR